MSVEQFPLYQINLVRGTITTEQQRQEIDAALMQIYSDPSSIPQVFQIIGTPGCPDVVRNYAALDLKFLMKKYGENFRAQGNEALLEQLKGMIMQLLPAIENNYIATNVMAALDPIIAHLEPWPELMGLVQTMLDSGELQRLNTVIVFFNSWVEFHGKRFIEFVPGLIGGVIQAGVSQTADHDVLINAMRLWGAVFEETDPPYDPFHMAAFEASMNYFKAWLAAEDGDKGATAAYIIADVMKKDCPIAPPAKMYEALLGIVGADDVPVNLKHLPTTPLQKLIKYHGEHVERYFPDTLRILMMLSASQFYNTHWSDELDARSISNVVCKMAESSSDTSEFMGVVKGLIGSIAANPATAFTCICILIAMIDAAPSAVEADCEFFWGFSSGALQMGNIAVAEAVMVLWNNLADECSGGIVEWATDMIPACMSFASMPGNDELVQLALQCLGTIFACLEIDSGLVMGMIEQVGALFGSVPEAIKSDVIQVFSTMMYCCKEDTAKMPDAVIALSTSAASCDAEGQENIKEAGVECLGYIVAYARERLGPEGLASAVEVIAGAMGHEYRNISRAALRAMQNAVKNGLPIRPGLVPFLWNIAIIKSKLESQEFDFWEIDRTAYCEGDVIIAAIDLIKTLARYHPEELFKAAEVRPGGFVTWCHEYFKVFLACEGDTTWDQKTYITGAAIMAAIYCKRITDRIGAPWPLFELLMETHRRTTKAKLAGRLFKGYCRAMEDEATLPAIAPFIPGFVELALAGLSRQLPCQLKAKSEEARFQYNEDLNIDLEKAITQAIFVCKAEFPIQALATVFSQILPKISEHETCSLLGVFADYVNIGGDLPPDFVGLALTKLPICDFSIMPDPIYLMRVIIRSKPELAAPHIGNLIQFFQEKITSEQTHDRYYWATVTNCISAILEVLCSPVFNSSVPFATMIEPILAKLPVKGDYDEANYIYQTLMVLVAGQAEQMQPHFVSLFQALNRILSKPNSYFEKCGTEDDVMRGLVNLWKNLTGALPNHMDLVAEALSGDEIRLARLQERVSKF